MTKDEFIFKVGKIVTTISSSIFPSVAIAQAILESGWGESGLTKNANALFGIKADKNWNGKVYNTKTFEVLDGKTMYITDGFRAYDSWEHSIIDHDDFLRRLSRYKPVLDAATPYIACNQLQTCGYATDPVYAQKLINLIDTYNLTMWDNVQTIPHAPAPDVSTKPAQESKIKNVEIIAEQGDTLVITVRVLGG